MENEEGCVVVQQYKFGKLLGQGSFAKVYHARNLKTGMSVAIKVIDKEKIMKVGMMDQIKREISVMRLVRHPNVVQLYEVMASKSKIYFVMEYIKGGELFNKVAKGRLKEDDARKFFQQLITAIDFCHSRGAYHRDLKPENLLVDENGNLKVSDFGLSALTESKRTDGLLHTACGTPAYVAPEVVNRNGYDGAKSDLWSCGVILFVLLAGRLPFHDSNLMEMYKKIERAEFKCPNWFSPDVRKLISRLLDPNPDSRISIPKIMDRTWFRKGFGPPKATMTDSTPVREAVDQFLSNAGGFSPCESTNAVSDEKQDHEKLANLNAFDIISLSAGFDLSGLFVDQDQKTEVRFSSLQPAKTIISKLEYVAKSLRMKVTKKEGGVLKLERQKEGRKGTLEIDAEIFEVTPNFHLVEVKKSNGDSMEYQKLMMDDIRPALKDVVWVWQTG
ncbi:hypothetical protein LIER_26313 [Lithospermum erythrorhizon]|uniref:non-specific serine/threonine protein kinase n=1 Tax=Lithospermum erythrorhizon TaxID=34254 RepID=A0AAV3RDR4_LITER